MSLPRQFIKFASVGACGTSVQYFILWLGVEHLSLSAVIASAIGYALGSIANYTLNYFLTFKSEKSHIETMPKYYAVIGVGWCINTALMGFFVHYISWPLIADRWQYIPSQILTTGIGVIWNFSGSRLWAFKPHKS